MLRVRPHSLCAVSSILLPGGFVCRSYFPKPLGYHVPDREPRPLLRPLSGERHRASGTRGRAEVPDSHHLQRESCVVGKGDSPR